MEPTLASTTRRRGHQHHPRHATRRRLDTSSRGPAQCGPAGIVKETTISSIETSSSPPSTRLDEKSGVIGSDCITAVTRTATVGARWHSDPTAEISKGVALKENAKTTKNTADDDDRKENVQLRLAQCSLNVPSDQNERTICEENEKQPSNDSPMVDPSEKSRSRPRGKEITTSKDDSNLTRGKDNSPEPEHAVARARGDGNSDDESTNVEEDPELAELAKLRCPSERAEVQAEREARRRKRCADYPGLAFGCSIFSSDTMMKFRLIKNELQNIMGNQLKRVSIA